VDQLGRTLTVSGRSVSGAGDVNGDGLADVIVDAPFADPDGKTLVASAPIAEVLSNFVA
jgi:hypothetical protein